LTKDSEPHLVSDEFFICFYVELQLAEVNSSIESQQDDRFQFPVVQRLIANVRDLADSMF
jgi:hypothetical protein